MKAPGFWWRKPGVAALTLGPLAACYGFFAARRMREKGAACGVPVICIGNLTLGGGGKTPLALAMAEMLVARGETPFLLTRGYGGRNPGPVRVDPARHSAEEVGDEPLLLARQAPTIVARDRIKGAAMARELGASVIVMDDGFQNPSLTKDFSIIAVDPSRGIGNCRVFPAGPLRAPLKAQLSRVDMIVLVGEGSVAKLEDAAGKWMIPVVRAQLNADPATVGRLRRMRVLAFAGIAHPEKFFASLPAAGIEVARVRAFGDHHVYTRAEMDTLLQEASQDQLTLVTTEKDVARLRHRPDAAALLARAQVFPIHLAFENNEVLARIIAAIKDARSGP